MTSFLKAEYPNLVKRKVNFKINFDFDWIVELAEDQQGGLRIAGFNEGIKRGKTTNVQASRKLC